jgi:hypothetical protein
MGKNVLITITLPNGHQTYFIARPSKIYPNRDFWFENMPSGNPGYELFEDVSGVDIKLFESLSGSMSSNSGLHFCLATHFSKIYVLIFFNWMADVQNIIFNVGISNPQKYILIFLLIQVGSCWVRVRVTRCFFLSRPKCHPTRILSKNTRLITVFVEKVAQKL